jgi:arylsulfatase A-like enzyme
MITVDTLRADHLGCYGYDKNTSPNIDALASDGAIFTRAYAPKGSTWPSLATLQTSLYPVTHGVRNNGLRMTNEFDQLAEVLKRHGYTCAAFLTNAGVQNWEAFDPKLIIREEPSDPIATNLARLWLKEHAGSQFFVWIHYIGPHSPWDAPPEFNKFGDGKYSGDLSGDQDVMAAAMMRGSPLNLEEIAYLVSLYDAEIAMTDHCVGQILSDLRLLKIYDDTLIMFSADHGEELYQHYEFLHHQSSVYEGTLRVPLLFRLSGTIPSGFKNDTLCGLIDVAPTLLDLIGIEIPSTYQGLSFASVFRDEPARLGPVFGEWRDKILYVRTEDYRYIYNPQNFHPPKLNNRRLKNVDAKVLARQNKMPIKEQELYDVRADPLEQREISADHPEVVARMRGILDGYMAEYEWKFGDSVANRMQSEIDPELRQQLEAQGYVMDADDKTEPQDDLGE